MTERYGRRPTEESGIPLRLSGHVLQNLAKIAEAETAVQALRHRGRLQARGPATASPGRVELGQRDRGPEPAPAGPLQRSDVVDPAVGAEVVRQCRGHDVVRLPDHPESQGTM